MLCLESFMRESFQDQPLEKRNVEIVTAAPLDGKTVVVDLGTKLPVIQNRQHPHTRKGSRNTHLWSPIKINWSVCGPSAVNTWLSKISPASSTRTTVGEAARIRAPCLAAPVVVQAMILFSFRIASVFLPYIRSIDAKQLLYASPVSYTCSTCSLKRASRHVFNFSWRSLYDIDQILNAFTTFSW
jgi:hypothetical protein